MPTITPLVPTKTILVPTMAPMVRTKTVLVPTIAPLVPAKTPLVVPKLREGEVKPAILTRQTRLHAFGPFGAGFVGAVRDDCADFSVVG